jgi:hypothetical protein
MPDKRIPAPMAARTTGTQKPPLPSGETTFLSTLAGFDSDDMFIAFTISILSTPLMIHR